MCGHQGLEFKVSRGEFPQSPLSWGTYMPVEDTYMCCISQDPGLLTQKLKLSSRATVISQDSVCLLLMPWKPNYHNTTSQILKLLGKPMKQNWRNTWAIMWNRDRNIEIHLPGLVCLLAGAALDSLSFFCLWTCRIRSQGWMFSEISCAIWLWKPADIPKALRVVMSTYCLPPG